MDFLLQLADAPADPLQSFVADIGAKMSGYITGNSTMFVGLAAIGLGLPFLIKTVRRALA